MHVTLHVVLLVCSCVLVRTSSGLSYCSAVMAEGKAKKRLFEGDSELDEFGSVSAICSPTKFAKVHGVLTSVSPMRKSASGCGYFDGRLSDGEKSLRIVGFDTKVQQKLMDFHSWKEPVALLNCEIKQGKYSSNLELHMRKTTELQKSPAKLDADVQPDLIMLDELPQLDQYQTVSVNVKVLIVKIEEEVKRGLMKQDCTVGDTTGTATITLWEDNVGTLAEGESYMLSGVKVRSFKGQKYLSVPRDGFKVTPIEDISSVNTSSIDLEESMQDVQVCGVKYFTTYKACCSGKAKVDPTTETVGKCSR